jgi:streptomycin 6-kinase
VVVVPDVLRSTVERLGERGQAWLEGLPALLAELEAMWSIDVGEPAGEGFTGLVLRATDSNQTEIVLKLGIPDGLAGVSPFSHEIDVLLLADGPPYVRVLRHDYERRAMLLERLGRPLGRLGLTVGAELDAIARTLPMGWKRVPASALTTDEAKATWLRRLIEGRWSSLGEPCSESTVRLAVEYAYRREKAFDPDTAVLIHGDAHTDNILETSPGSRTYALIDPAGLIGEPAHDLAIPLRERTDVLLAGDCVKLLRTWCETLAGATEVDPVAIWEWAYIERVATAFVFVSLGLQDDARNMLRVADLISGRTGLR